MRAGKIFLNSLDEVTHLSFRSQIKNFSLKIQQGNFFNSFINGYTLWTIECVPQIRKNGDRRRIYIMGKGIKT